jgi:hypothetical protein
VSSNRSEAAAISGISRQQEQQQQAAAVVAGNCNSNTATAAAGAAAIAAAASSNSSSSNNSNCACVPLITLWRADDDDVAAAALCCSLHAQKRGCECAAAVRLKRRWFAAAMVTPAANNDSCDAARCLGACGNTLSARGYSALLIACVNGFGAPRSTSDSRIVSGRRRSKEQPQPKLKFELVRLVQTRLRSIS